MTTSQGPQTPSPPKSLFATASNASNAKRKSTASSDEENPEEHSFFFDPSSKPKRRRAPNNFKWGDPSDQGIDSTFHMNMDVLYEVLVEKGTLKITRGATDAFWEDMAVVFSRKARQLYPERWGNLPEDHIICTSSALKQHMTKTLPNRIFPKVFKKLESGAVTVTPEFAEHGELLQKIKFLMDRRPEAEEKKCVAAAREASSALMSGSPPLSKLGKPNNTKLSSARMSDSILLQAASKMIPEEADDPLLHFEEVMTPSVSTPEERAAARKAKGRADRHTPRKQNTMHELASSLDRLLVTRAQPLAAQAPPAPPPPRATFGVSVVHHGKQKKALVQEGNTAATLMKLYQCASLQQDGYDLPEDFPLAPNACYVIPLD